MNGIASVCSASVMTLLSVPNNICNRIYPLKKYFGFFILHFFFVLQKEDEDEEDEEEEDYQPSASGSEFGDGSEDDYSSEDASAESEDDISGEGYLLLIWLNTWLSNHNNSTVMVPD